MKQTLQLGLRQHLAMTPQLQQAIRLLQLSVSELQTEVQEALDTNYMLERAEEAGDPKLGPDARSRDPAAGSSNANAEVSNEPPAETTVEPVDIPGELAVDTEWDVIYEPPIAVQQHESPGATLHAPIPNTLSLRGHLIAQLELLHLSASDRLIGEVLIDGIDDDGYLTLDSEEVAELVRDPTEPELGELEVEEIDCVLKQIQNFEPPGVGARDLRECLLLQLHQRFGEPHLRSLAISLVEDHLASLEARDFERLKRDMDLDESTLQAVIAFIRTLDPKPGSVISEKDVEYVIPDVVVKRGEKGWHVELNSDAMPHLRINSMYASFVRRGDNSPDNESLRRNLSEARWFIKSLHSRSETLLKVATCIVERQRAFFERGPEAMKPMVLHDVAEAVGMHESTISRVTTRKYMQTPRGLVELKYFFSSQLLTDDGETTSSTAIKALIKKLIAEENPRKPLSDNKLTALLVQEGIQVARRTVAKYRESLHIASSNERKRLS